MASASRQRARQLEHQRRRRQAGARNRRKHRFRHRRIDQLDGRDVDAHLWQVVADAWPTGRSSARLLENVVAYRVDQARSLGLRQEVGRCQRSASRMAPADERLGTNNRGSAEPHHGLILQPEFISVEGLGEVVYQVLLIVPDYSSRHINSTSKVREREGRHGAARKAGDTVAQRCGRYVAQTAHGPATGALAGVQRQAWAASAAGERVLLAGVETSRPAYRARLRLRQVAEGGLGGRWPRAASARSTPSHANAPRRRSRVVVRGRRSQRPGRAGSCRVHQASVCWRAARSG